MGMEESTGERNYLLSSYRGNGAGLRRESENGFVPIDIEVSWNIHRFIIYIILRKPQKQ